MAYSKKIRRPLSQEVAVVSEADVFTGNPLDSPESLKRFQQIEDWWYQARQAQAMNRYEQALDQDFHDGLQWNDDDRKVVEDRGQVACVFNLIKGLSVNRPFRDRTGF